MIKSVNHMTGLGKREHLQLEFTFSCYTETTKTVFTKSNFFIGNYTGLTGELALVDWLQVIDGIDLTTSWEILTEKLSNLIETYIPLSKVSQGTAKKTPYITQNCQDAIRRNFQSGKSIFTVNQTRIMKTTKNLEIGS